MYSPILLVIAISSSMILASPVPAAQFGGSTSFDLSFDPAGGSGTIASPNYNNFPPPNTFFSPPQTNDLLLASAEYQSPQPSNLFLTDYTTPPAPLQQENNPLLLANTEDPRAVEQCRSQGNCGLLGNPVPTQPDPPRPLTPDMQWINDKSSQPITAKFLSFQCGGTQSVCCENWHHVAAGPQMTSTSLWLSCSNKQSVVSAGSSGIAPDLNFVCIQPTYYHDCDSLRQSPEATAQSPDGVSRKCYSDCPNTSAQLQFPVQWG